MRRSARLAAVAIACAVVPLGAGPALAAPAAPSSCAEAVAAQTTPTDGPVTLVVGTVAVPVWCADTATTPVEYLTLTRTGPGQNESFSPTGGGFVGTDATVRFQRVRLLLPAAGRSDFAVVLDDLRFATVTGARFEASSPTTPVAPPGFASAGECRATDDGRADVDLRDTPFGVQRGQFTLYGFLATGSTTHSAGDQVLDLTGGGYCGANGPTGTDAGRAVLRLTVLDSVPVVVDQPLAATTVAGSTTTFTSTATGAPVVSTRWQTSADSGTTWTDVPGATGPVATLTAPAAPGGAVLVRALHSTPAGDTASEAVLLRAAPAPTPAPTPVPSPTPTPTTDVAAPTGAPAAPELAATGADPAPLLGLGGLLVVAGAGLLVGQCWRTGRGSAPTARSACTSRAPSGPSATV